MTNNDFNKQKQAAEQVMREMNARASKKNYENENFQPNTEHKNPNTNKVTPQKSEIPFSLSKLLKDSDTTLILGLLLILFSEDADKRLLFALIYILL